MSDQPNGGASRGATPGIRARIEAQRDALPSALEQLTTGVALIDDRRIYRLANPAFCALLGVPAADVLGRTIERVWPGPGAAQVAEDAARALAGHREPRTYQVVVERATRWLRVHFHPLDATSHGGGGILLEVQDVSDLLRAEQKASVAARVYETANEGILMCDEHGVILAVNSAYAAVAGISKEECLGRHVSEVLPVHEDYLDAYADLWRTIRAEGYWQGELWRRRHSGEVFPQWLTINRVYDGGEARYVAVSSDITELHESQRRAEYLATHDTLTGLPNRTLFLDRLRRSVLAGRRGLRITGLLLVDIEHLKLVNDSLGHHVGDQLLTQIARRLSDLAEPADTVARIAGDEFALVMERRNIDEVEADGARMLAELGRQFVCGAHVIDTRLRVGAAFAPLDGKTAEEPIKAADLALYRAKESGKGAIEVFRPELQGAYLARLDIERRLRVALAQGELTIALQAQVDAAHPETIVGYEALVRWRTEDGYVPPDEFIPVAEASDLIVELDHYVLARALDTVRRLPDRVTIAVNVSSRTMDEPGFSGLIRSRLALAGVAPERLIVEVTERALVSDETATLATMHELREMGVQFSIDDFGTGFSSLSYLRTLPVCEIKIDRSFVADLGVGDEGDELITEAIIKISHALGFRVLAEGVETSAQAEWLVSRGCDVLQGFLFARPQLADEVLEQIEPTPRSSHR